MNESFMSSSLNYKKVVCLKHGSHYLQLTIIPRRTLMVRDFKFHLFVKFSLWYHAFLSSIELLTWVQYILSVKFSITSFKVSELYIEVPETATVGSLKVFRVSSFPPPLLYSIVPHLPRLTKNLQLTISALLNVENYCSCCICQSIQLFI